MTGIRVSTDQTFGVAGELRVLGGLWLAGAAVTAVPAFMLAGASDHVSDRWPGGVLAVMVLVAVAVGGRLVAAPRLAALPASLGASIAWLVAAGVVYPTQAHAADAVWAGGVPAVVAVLTGAVAWWVHRSERRAAAF